MANKKAEINGTKGNFDYIFIVENDPYGDMWLTMKMHVHVYSNEIILDGLTEFLEEYYNKDCKNLPDHVRLATHDLLYNTSSFYFHLGSTGYHPHRLLKEVKSRFFEKYPFSFFQTKIGEYFLKLNRDLFNKKTAPNSNQFYVDDDAPYDMTYLSKAEQREIGITFTNILVDLAEKEGITKIIKDELDEGGFLKERIEDQKKLETLAKKLGYELKKPKKATGGRQPICMRKS